MERLAQQAQSKKLAKKAEKDDRRFAKKVAEKSTSAEVVVIKGFNIRDQDTRLWLEGSLRQPSASQRSVVRVYHVGVGDG